MKATDACKNKHELYSNIRLMKKLFPCILMDGRWRFSSAVGNFDIRAQAAWGLFTQCCLELLNSPWLTFAWLAFVQMPHLIATLNK